MQTIRLAYAAEYLIALIAVYVLWSEVGGQTHLDVMPWYWKLPLGAGAAYAAVKATAAAVAAEHAWNGRTLKWCGVLLVLLLACGLASYYAHLYLEDNGDDQSDENTAAVWPMQSSWRRADSRASQLSVAWPCGIPYQPRLSKER